MRCDIRHLINYLRTKLLYNEEDAPRIAEELRELQLCQDRIKVPAFFIAAEHGQNDIVHTLLSSTCDTFTLISSYFRFAVSNLFTFPINSKSLLYMLLHIPEDIKTALLGTRYGLLETTILHSAIIKKCAETVRVIRESVDPVTFYELLQIKNNWGRTPFHFACMAEESECLELILNEVDSDQCFDLVKKRDIGGLTPVQDIPDGQVETKMEMIKNSLTEEQWVDALMLPLPKDHKDGIYGKSLNCYRKRGKTDSHSR